MDSSENTCDNQSTMQWISVRESLPKYEKKVLFVNGKNEISVGQRFPHEKDYDEWASEESIYFEDCILCQWTLCKFWMNLPKLPNKK